MVTKRTSARLGLSCAALFLLASCFTREPQLKDTEGPPSFAATVQKAPTVSFCDLVRDSEPYDKKIVRAQALFFRNMENGYLYDPTCGSENTYVWVEFDPAYVYTDDAVKKKLDQALCPAQPCPIGRARVTAVGRFDGPREGPYGHLDGYRFRFSLIRLEQAEEVTDAINQSRRQ